jgi:tetrahydromethanopterin S-methyltransferase subunit B
MVGIVTTAGESFSPVLEKVAALEATSDDLINMLSGSGNLLASFPNRENGLKIGGAITSFWYGLAVGLFIAGIIAFQLIKVG